MSEDYAISFRKNIATTPTTGKGWVDALRTVFNDPTYGWNPSGIGVDGRRRWYVDPSDTGSGGAMANAGFLLLRATPQNFTPAPTPENPDNQQILVSGSLSLNRVSFLYAPNGGINSSNYSQTWTVGSTGGINTTGFRSITSDGAAITTATGSLFVSEYRERQETFAPYPASALAVFIGGSAISNSKPIFRFGCHVGRIFNPDNANDSSNSITGDGILAGLPNIDMIATSTGWLRRDSSADTTYLANGSIVRVGNSDWSCVTPMITYPASFTTSTGSLSPLWTNADAEISAVNDKFFPHAIRLNAYLKLPVPPTASFGEVGASKYLRTTRRNFPNQLKLLSNTIPMMPSDPVLERQAWLTFNGGTITDQNIVVLWGNKTFNI